MKVKKPMIVLPGKFLKKLGLMLESWSRKMFTLSRW